VTTSTELRQQQPDTPTAGRRRGRGRAASRLPSSNPPSSNPPGSVPPTARPSSAERRCRRVAAAVLLAHPPRGGRRRTVTASRTTTSARLRAAGPRGAAGPHAALRTTTGLALVALGLILLWAVRATASVVNVHMAGLVLIVIGAAWLWIPVRDKRGLLQRLFDAAMTYLSFDGSVPAAAREEGASQQRCSLEEMLSTQAAASMPGDVSPSRPVCR
jgi:hypothetical protein